MCKEDWLVQLGQEGCVNVRELSEIPEKGVKQKRGEGKQRFKKGGGGQAASRGEYFKKGGEGGLEPPYEL